jgi:hypothetical protein
MLVTKTNNMFCIIFPEEVVKSGSINYYKNGGCAGILKNIDMSVVS